MGAIKNPFSLFVEHFPSVLQEIPLRKVISELLSEVISSFPGEKKKCGARQSLIPAGKLPRRNLNQILQFNIFCPYGPGNLSRSLTEILQVQKTHESRFFPEKSELLFQDKIIAVSKKFLVITGDGRKKD